MPRPKVRNRGRTRRQQAMRSFRGWRDFDFPENIGRNPLAGAKEAIYYTGEDEEEFWLVACRQLVWLVGRKSSFAALEAL